MKPHFWQETSIISIALVVAWSVIVWPLFEIDRGTFMASVLAGTSGILLAMSFSLSSFSYYFDFLDSKVVYRKYLGLMGYFFALGYVAIVVGMNPGKYFSHFPGNVWTIDIGLGALAMSILTVMALVSNNKAAQWLGGKTWKNILGLGYVAYAMLVIRGIFLDASLWEAWLTTEESVFTIRMTLTFIGILVLLFRASVPTHKKFFKTESYV